MNLANNAIKQEEAKLSKVKPVTNPEEGGLYEIWVAESPEAALVIGPALYGCFNVIVGRRRETIPKERIFETGTAPRPDVLERELSLMALDITDTEDRKILKMLSETMLNK